MTQPPDIITKLLHIYGQVQGVGYRVWAKHMAGQCRLTGWIKNLNDGSVQLLASGFESDMKRFITDCHKGPANAKVDFINIGDGANERLKDFEIREDN